MPERDNGITANGIAEELPGQRAEAAGDRAPRAASFELMRIVLMLMIVTLHYLYQGGFLLGGSGPDDAASHIGNAAESLCIGAVNTFVLLSGYFLSCMKADLRRAWRFYLTVWTYSTAVPLILGILGVPVLEEGIYSAARYVLPVLSEHYWFASAYFILLVLSPLLNAAMDRADRKTLIGTTAALLVLFSAVKSVCPVRLPLDRFGYDFGWFIVLYLTGGLIRRYPDLVPGGRRTALGIYFGSGAGIAVLGELLYLIHEKTGALDYYMNVPFHYKFILAYTEAVGLFLVFRGLEIPEGRTARTARRIGPLVFGVYLLHAGSVLFDRWYPALCSVIGKAPRSPLFLLHLAAGVLIVFAAGIAAESFRSKLFARGGTRLLFPAVLLLWPLTGTAQGVNLADPTYSLTNYLYPRTGGSWFYATYLANRLGMAFTAVSRWMPGGYSLRNMNLLCALVVSATALVCFFALKRLLDARTVFAGLMLAVSFAWCPAVILYNTLTYLVFAAGVLVLFYAAIKDSGRAYILAGVLLGLNVTVRFSNLFECLVILALWWYLAVKKTAFSRALGITLKCVGGYLAGFAVPAAASMLRYGAGGYAAMIPSLLGMSGEASDYSLASMLADTARAWLSAGKWFALILIPVLAGAAVIGAADCCFAGSASGRPDQQGKKNRMPGLILRAGYIAGIAVLFRFLYGRGMFNLNYQDYWCMFSFGMLFAIIAVFVLAAAMTGRHGETDAERLLAALSLMILLLSPLGSNNYTFPMLNNLYIPAPFVLHLLVRYYTLIRSRSASGGTAGRDGIKQPVFARIPQGVYGGLGFAVSAMTAALIAAAFVQSALFHISFSFGDGTDGTARSAVIRDIPFLEGMHTTPENAARIVALREALPEEGTVLAYGNLPGIAAVFGLEPALDNAWPDLKSFGSAVFIGNMDRLERSGARPVIVLGPLAEPDTPAEAAKRERLERFMNANGYNEIYDGYGTSVWK